MITENISCICPTKNREKFLNNLINIYLNQDFPINKRELIILDDSDEINNYFNQENNYIYKKIDLNYNNEKQELEYYYNTINNINYYYSKKKIILGKKRNILNILTKYNYIICLDDDDYYPNDKISYTHEIMLNNNNLIYGCGMIYVYNTNDKNIYKIGNINNPSYVTNGTLSYKKKYLETYKYDDNKYFGEEYDFINLDMLYLIKEPLKCILCISHTSNTFDKNSLLKKKNLILNLEINKCVDKKFIKFYNDL